MLAFDQLSQATAPAIETAKRISESRFVCVSPIPYQAALIARFSSDQGLRCFGQTSLVNCQDGTTGIVIQWNGKIPRQDVADSLLMPHLYPPQMESV